MLHITISFSGDFAIESCKMTRDYRGISSLGLKREKKVRIIITLRHLVFVCAHQNPLFSSAIESKSGVDLRPF